MKVLTCILENAQRNATNDRSSRLRNERRTGAVCTWHHALQSTEVDVCAVIQQIEDLICVLLNLILDVHLTALLILLLSGQGVVHSEPTCQGATQNTHSVCLKQ